MNQAEIPVTPETVAEPGRRLSVRLTTPTLRWLIAGLFLLDALVLFLPWQRVLVPGRLQAATPPVAIKDLVLIVGCPASLNERTPAGELKLDAVKKAAGTFIDKLPERVRLALVVYGNNRDAECGVATARKLGPLDSAARSELNGILAKINPVGLAPLAKALKQAGDELASNAGSGGIILIGDTVDTCEGDAKAEAAALAKRRELTYGVHVLGFGVIPKDLRPLRNIAQTGKGKFHDAQTSAELDEMVATVLKETGAAAEETFITGSLADAKQTGLRMAFGADPLPAAFLMMLYCLLTFLGLCGALAALTLPKLPQTRDGLALRLSPWIGRALLAVSAIALLLLVVQMVIGFPIETGFRQYVFTYRSLWLYFALVLSMATTAAAYLLYRRESHPQRLPVSAQVEW